MKPIQIFALMLLIGAVCAGKLTYQTQNELLWAARYADIGDYYAASGVVVQDTPKLDPHFSCLRVGLKSYASIVDKLSCPRNSHASTVERAIKQYETDPAGALYTIRSHIPYDVPIFEALTPAFQMQRMNTGLI